MSTTITQEPKATPTIVDEPNPPSWDDFDSVIVLNPDQSKEEVQNLVAKTQDNCITDKGETVFLAGRHFTEERYAILFEPGTYRDIDVEVGYYSQVLGLGASPKDVSFQDCAYGPYVPALRKNEQFDNGAFGMSLDTFWRCGENYQTQASKGQLWAVSQAAPLRRVHIAKNGSGDSSGTLHLNDNGAMASGGHVADVIVEGALDLGSQQQFCFRSVSFENQPTTSQLGSWSFMFVDCENPPTARDGVTSQPIPIPNTDYTINPSVTLEDPTVTVEKPFIVMNPADKKCNLYVPPPRTRPEGTSLGPDFKGQDEPEFSIRPFEKVMVAAPDVKGIVYPDLSVASRINSALKDGKDIVLSPGIYHLDEPLQITKKDQVILGIGLATLVAPTDGRPCIKVPPGLEGVRIAGIMLEASVLDKKDDSVASCFIQWGEKGDSGNPNNPGVLTDIFARVGGSNLQRTVSTDTMIRIDSGNIYGDNLWLWRADHVQLRPNEEPNVDGLDYHQVTLGECPCKTGLEVNGNDVHIHGLAVEHTIEHNVIWNGERGRVSFFQNELPYDVTAAFGENGYCGYKVDDNVTTHVAKAAGVYSNFRDYEVPIPSAMLHPTKEGTSISFINPFTVWLNNKGQIQSVVNSEGDPLEKKGDVGRVNNSDVVDQIDPSQ